MENFSVRNIREEDVEQLLQINEFANSKRSNPRQWVNGFNSLKLNTNILLSLIEEYKNSQEDIFWVCADENGKVVGYLIAFFINRDNLKEHCSKLKKVFSESIKKLILLEINPEQILTISLGFEDFWGEIERNRDTLCFTFGLQVAIHQNFLRKGLGRLLFNKLFDESKKKKSMFFVGDVEIFPSFNLAQFEFLFKKLDLKIASIVNTKFNLNLEEERCALFYKKL